MFFDLFGVHFVFNQACQKQPLKMELIHIIKLYTDYFSFYLVYKNLMFPIANLVQWRYAYLLHFYDMIWYGICMLCYEI